MFRIILILILGLLSAFAARAQTNQILVVNPSVPQLGQGKMRVSMNSSVMSSDQVLDDGGHIQALGEKWRNSLTWKQLVAYQNISDPAHVTQRQQWLQSIQSQGHGSDEIVATNSYNVGVDYEVFNLRWAYGMSRTWTMDVQIPWINKRIHVVRDSALTPMAAQKLSQKSKNPYPEKISKADLEQAMAAQQEAMNYDSFTERNEASFGDLELRNRVQMWRNRSQFLSLVQKLTIPTAAPRSIFRDIDVPYADGQYDFGISALWDWRIRSRWLLSALVGYTVQFADKVATRTDDNEARLRGIDNQVNRDLGDQTEVSLFHQFGIGGGFQFLSNYHYRAKARDHYSGTQIYNYSQLAENSDQIVHLAEVGLGYQTHLAYDPISGTQEFVGRLTYSSLLRGTNVVRSPIGSLELSLIF